MPLRLPKNLPKILLITFLFFFIIQMAIFLFLLLSPLLANAAEEPQWIDPACWTAEACGQCKNQGFPQDCYWGGALPACPGGRGRCYAASGAIPLGVPIGETTEVGGPKKEPLADYIATLYKYTVSIGGILATVMIIWGGIVYLTAGGNPGRIGQAKEYISNALIGVVLLFTSYLLLQTINPDLVKLSMPRVYLLQKMKTATWCDEYKNDPDVTLNPSSGTCGTEATITVKQTAAAVYPPKCTWANCDSPEKPNCNLDTKTCEDLCRKAGQGNIDILGALQAQCQANTPPSNDRYWYKCTRTDDQDCKAWNDWQNACCLVINDCSKVKDCEDYGRSGDNIATWVSGPGDSDNLTAFDFPSIKKEICEGQDGGGVCNLPTSCTTEGVRDTDHRSCWGRGASSPVGTAGETPYFYNRYRSLNGTQLQDRVCVFDVDCKSGLHCAGPPFVGEDGAVWVPSELVPPGGGGFIASAQPPAPVSSLGAAYEFGKCK